MKIIDMMGKLLNNRRKNLIINSMEDIEKDVLELGILPFFRNNIKGLSIEELCSPGMLFGGNFEEGCWEWKGPVIRRKTTAYGKFFRKKAGFVALDLFPDFINYRRSLYPIKPESTEDMLLEIIKENNGLSSTELKRYIFGGFDTKREWFDLPSSSMELNNKNVKRKSLESPLQRLQMGGWIIISDFSYKFNKKGVRYGWGVANYTTPELNFGQDLKILKGVEPETSLQNIINSLKETWPQASRKSLEHLLK